MKIEAGKYYRTRDGRKVGPMEFISKRWADETETQLWSDVGGAYYTDGTHYSKTQNDLISELEDEPHCDMVWTPVKEKEPKEYIKGHIERSEPDTDYAALAAEYGIKITVQVGEVIVEYDGRK